LAIDRDTTLKHAERSLREGRLDDAIEAYSSLVADEPDDWNAANTLGDLYLRSGQPGQAVPLYRRIALHLLDEGFYPKAGALYKKILKIAPADNEAQLRLAEIAARQGKLADARAHYRAVEMRRRQGGDAAGADEILIRLGDLDVEDFAARRAAAEAVERAGRIEDALARYRALHDDLIAQGQEAEATAVHRECVRLQPGQSTGDAQVAAVTAALQDGQIDAARRLFIQMVGAGSDPGAVLDIARTLLSAQPAYAGEWLEAAADTYAQAGAYGQAAMLLREVASRPPARVPLLLRLVEVCVDGGLESEMFDAQAQLTDAYLAAGQADDAMSIAEDMVARFPTDPHHAGRLRRAREMRGAEPGATAKPETTVARPARPAQKSEPATVEIDLTAVLLELQQPPAAAQPPAPPPRSLESVFDGLRADAEVADAADTDAEHLGLAKTYLEMGQPEEAARSLEIAARSPQHRFAASSMLAQLHRDNSDLGRAIEWFERAAEAPAPTPEDGRALLYDLGDVLETVGEAARALAVFLELQTDAPQYRDVRERVTRLSRVETEG
jgi:tetratricopeptide (TPR) repeat protein